MSHSTSLFAAIVLAAAIGLTAWFSGVATKGVVRADLGGTSTTQTSSGW